TGIVASAYSGRDDYWAPRGARQFRRYGRMERCGSRGGGCPTRTHRSAGYERTGSRDRLFDTRPTPPWRIVRGHRRIHDLARRADRPDPWTADRPDASCPGYDRSRRGFARLKLAYFQVRAGSLGPHGQSARLSPTVSHDVRRL